MSVTAGAAEIVVMPAILRARESGCETALRRQLLRLAMLAVIPISLLVIGVVWAITPGVGFVVLAILMPIPVMATASAVLMGFLNAGGQFKRAVVSPVYGALLGIPVLLILPPTAITLASVFLLFEVGRVLGLKMSMSSAGSVAGTEEVRSATRVLVWAIRGAILQMVGSLLAAINPLVDVFFAKILGAGTVSQVSYANRLWNMVPLLFAGMLTLLHFEWSRAASVGRLRGQDVVQNARRLGAIAFIGSLLAIALAPWLIDLMYGHGLMTVRARQDLSVLLRAYLIGTGPFLAGVIYVRALSATGKIHVITLVAVAGLLANAFLDWYLMGLFGSAGIGLSTSIVYLISLVILHYYWRHSAEGMIEDGGDGA